MGGVALCHVGVPSCCGDNSHRWCAWVRVMLCKAFFIVVLACMAVRVNKNWGRTGVGSGALICEAP